MCVCERGKQPREEVCGDMKQRQTETGRETRDPREKVSVLVDDMP